MNNDRLPGPGRELTLQVGERGQEAEEEVDISAAEHDQMTGGGMLILVLSAGNCHTTGYILHKTGSETKCNGGPMN